MLVLICRGAWSLLAHVHLSETEALSFGFQAKIVPSRG